MYKLLIRNCRVSGEMVDVAVEGGMISAVARGIRGGADTEIEADGRLLSAPFVESHIHLESTLTAREPRPNQSGTLFEGIEIWSERRRSLTREDVLDRARELLRWQAAQGVLHVRTHVDVTDPELLALKTLIELKESVSGWIELQIVAFPQEGVSSHPRGSQLLEEAIRLGADVVGGIPHYEHTRELGVSSVQECFRIAEDHDRAVDLHCGETDDPNSRFLEVVAAEALRRELGPRVTASHTTAFGSYDEAYAAKLMRLLKESGINLVANPLINMTLQGRFDSYPRRRGLTRVKELWQNGLNVSLGYDNVMDPWYPLGTANMIQPAHMAVHACHMTSPEEVVACFSMVTDNAARTLELTGYGVVEGTPADFILLDAADEWEAIRRLATATLVVKSGEIIGETRPARTRLLGEQVHFGLNKRSEAGSG